MAYRKRSGSGSKRHLKEKVVLMYEILFKGEDPTSGNQNFWDEFFLLKPKVTQLEAEIAKITADQVLVIQENLHVLVMQCISTLTNEQLRIFNSTQTLCALVDGISKKARNDPRLDVVDLLFGKDEVKQSVELLVENVNCILTGDVSLGLKTLTLKLLLLLVTCSDDLNENPFLEHLMSICVFKELVQLLKVPVSRVTHGQDVVLLLTLLVSYRKHEAANPYSVELSVLDDELTLHGLGQVITNGLTDFCRSFTAQHTEPPAGWLTSITFMVGNMFVSEEGGKGPQLRANNPALLALYEAVHLNRNFVAVLTHAQTDVQPLSSPLAESNSTSSPSHIVSQPSTLLGTFFQYCSIVMQDTKSEASANIVKLCFFILTCITEDHYANALMHDANLVFQVQLHRLPMRHRKLAPDKLAPSQPLASTLHDLLVEFIMSHMMKKLLPLELYMVCIGIVHRLLCYQKRCCVRLNYQWKELWSALTAFLKFLVANESHLTKRMDIFELAITIVNIFNLFITYGDTFLPAPGCYDELYYEIIRMHQVFDDLYSWARRYSSAPGKYQDHAIKLTNCLVNVRAIINHFSPKIEQWLAQQGLSTPSEDQILELVQKNYDSLTLKLQDSLDQFERYAEKPLHVNFFASIMSTVVSDSRIGLDYSLSLPILDS